MRNSYCEQVYCSRRMADGYTPYLLMNEKQISYPCTKEVQHSLEAEARDRAGDMVNAKLQAAALLALEVHCADRLTALDGMMCNPLSFWDTVAMRRAQWQNLPSLTQPWSIPFTVTRLHGLQCWLRDRIGRVTREVMDIHRTKPYVVRH